MVGSARCHLPHHIHVPTPHALSAHKHNLNRITTVRLRFIGISPNMRHARACAQTRSRSVTVWHARTRIILLCPALVAVAPGRFCSPLQEPELLLPPLLLALLYPPYRWHTILFCIQPSPFLTLFQLDWRYDTPFSRYSWTTVVVFSSQHIHLSTMQTLFMGQGTPVPS